MKLTMTTFAVAQRPGDAMENRLGGQRRCVHAPPDRRRSVRARRPGECAAPGGRGSARRHDRGRARGPGWSRRDPGRSGAHRPDLAAQEATFSQASARRPRSAASPASSAPIRRSSEPDRSAPGDRARCRRRPSSPGRSRRSTERRCWISSRSFVSDEIRQRPRSVET